MRRLRAGARNPALGRSRDPTRGALRPLCEELAGQGRLGPPRAEAPFRCRACGAKVPGKKRRGPGSADPGSEIAAMERRGARASRQTRTRLARRGRMVAPCGAPSPRHVRGARERPRNAGQGIRPFPAPPRIRAQTLACLLSPTRRRGRDQKIPPPKPLSVRNKVSKPITRCTAAFFLAISARFPVGVKRPFMRPSSTLLAPGGSVSSASSVYQLRLRPP